MPTVHAFISYSRTTSKAADRIVKSLEEVGIPVWIDRAELEPGTPNWESTIRKALRDSFAFILLASPTAGESVFVSHEYQLAQGFNCPIFPIWVEGTNWALSVPFGLSSTQYVDCRDALTVKAVKTNLSGLVKQLKFLAPKHLLDSDTSPESLSCYLSIDVKTTPRILVNPLLYKTLGALIDDIYMVYLRNLYLAFTYAKSWLLVSGRISAHSIGRVAAPWSILLRPKLTMPLHEYDPNWSALVPSEYGLLPGTSWFIQDAQNMALVGIVENSPNFARLFSEAAVSDRPNGSLQKSIYYDIGQRDLPSVNEINSELYQYKMVVALDRDQVAPQNVFGKVVVG